MSSLAIARPQPPFRDPAKFCPDAFNERVAVALAAALNEMARNGKRVTAKNCDKIEKSALLRAVPVQVETYHRKDMRTAFPEIYGSLLFVALNQFASSGATSLPAGTFGELNPKVAATAQDLLRLPTSHDRATFLAALAPVGAELKKKIVPAYNSLIAIYGAERKHYATPVQQSKAVEVLRVADEAFRTLPEKVRELVEEFGAASRQKSAVKVDDAWKAAGYAAPIAPSSGLPSALSSARELVGNEQSATLFFALGKILGSFSPVEYTREPLFAGVSELEWRFVLKATRDYFIYEANAHGISEPGSPTKLPPGLAAMAKELKATVTSVLGSDNRKMVRVSFEDYKRELYIEPESKPKVATKEAERKGKGDKVGKEVKVVAGGAEKKGQGRSSQNDLLRLSFSDGSRLFPPGVRANPIPWLGPLLYSAAVLDRLARPS